MSDKPKTHTLNLTQAALRLLASMLVAPGWSDNTGDSYRAGELLECPEVADLPAGPNEKAPIAEHKAWDSVLVALVVSERQRDTAKKCVEHFLKNGRTPNGAPLNRVLRELGLSPQD